MTVEVCTGSNMDGVDIDLVKFAGLPELSDDEYDLLWRAGPCHRLIQWSPNGGIFGGMVAFTFKDI